MPWRTELSQPLSASAWADITGKPTTLAGFALDVEADARYKTLEAVIAPTLLNAWVNYDATNYVVAGYYKTPQGEIVVRGMIKNGTVDTVAFTLPVGYRPAKNLFAACVSNGLFGSLQLSSVGNVTPETGSNIWWALSARFRSD